MDEPPREESIVAMYNSRFEFPKEPIAPEYFALLLSEYGVVVPEGESVWESVIAWFEDPASLENEHRIIFKMKRYLTQLTFTIVMDATNKTFNVIYIHDPRDLEGLKTGPSQGCLEYITHQWMSEDPIEVNYGQRDQYAPRFGDEPKLYEVRELRSIKLDNVDGVDFMNRVLEAQPSDVCEFLLYPELCEGDALS